jgi:hypothetical protein
MEKFEYFPIKCRIQRAADMFQTARAKAENELLLEKEEKRGQSRVKSKVRIVNQITINTGHVTHVICPAFPS